MQDYWVVIQPNNYKWKSDMLWLYPQDLTHKALQSHSFMYMGYIIFLMPFAQ
jgi:hypothetical protein